MGVGAVAARFFYYFILFFPLQHRSVQQPLKSPALKQRWKHRPHLLSKHLHESFPLGSLSFFKGYI